MKQLILIVAIFQCILCKAQQPMPGGVTGAYIWEITENKQSDIAQWKSRLKSTVDTSLVITGKSKSINNNPALYFNAGAATNTLDLGQLATFTLFTVCQDEDTLSEKILVSVENETAAEMVLTNQRVAALDVY